MRWFATAITTPRFTHWYLSSPTLAALLAYYALLVCACWLAWNPPRRSVGRRCLRWACLTSAVLVPVLWYPLSYEPKVVVLDVGQGDSIFIRSEGGHTVLVDTGLANEQREEEDDPAKQVGGQESQGRSQRGQTDNRAPSSGPTT